MFTGITRGLFEVVSVKSKANLKTYRVAVSAEFASGLTSGDSVAVDGVCQSITQLDSESWLEFDAIQETLERTTLKNLKTGMRVNLERSARIGDEIGGHLISGHVRGTAKIAKVHRTGDQAIFTFQMSEGLIQDQAMDYLFSKGYVAIDGMSLTLVDILPQGFTVHVIPETLQKTTFSFKKEGDDVNIELDASTVTIVDTVKRVLSR